MPETVKAPKKGYGIMNSFVSDIFERIAGSPPVWLNTTTLPPSPSPQGDPDRCPPAAARELAKHAVSEGTKAVTKYTSSK
uniref:Histone H2B-like n=1 Tax=Labrus bergylta TaxID=56723 RepID=A0A3Q3FRS0_9LABR